MKYLKDLREHIQVLEEKGKLVRIKRPINKDTQLHPLVRWQFRGLEEEDRKAFLFENVFDSKGKKYNIPVVAAAYAPSRDIYAIGMMCKPEEIAEKWINAERNPISPRIVEKGPVQEEIHLGSGLLEHGGLEEFPIPISTPGFDNAPYLTAANWVTKDPETGIRNVGNYRGMVKSPDRLGICALGTQHLRIHWQKSVKQRKPLPAAIVIGTAPNIGFVATAKIPYGLDEYAVAGGIAGEPVKLVKCKTVDVEVPATAEIVIEGELPVDYMEKEGPFGELTGFMGMEQINPYFNVKCITHRKNPIYTVFSGQFPPSEANKLRQVASEALYYKFLKYDCNIPGILDVVFYEMGGSIEFMVLRLKKNHPAEVWQALGAAASLGATIGKIIIAVDDDIDPKDPNSVIWALSYRVQPHRDTRIIMGKEAALDPSAAPPWTQERRYPEPSGCSALLIDATHKWPYPPTSLPKKEFMEEARKIWEEEGLQPLKPRIPWYGYSLGFWTEEHEEEAQLALRGEHFKTGEKLASKRIKVQ